MKILTCSLLAIVTLLTSVVRLHSQGYIVPNGVIEYTGYPDPGTEIDVLYNPTAVPPNTSDYTGFLLIPRNTSTFVYDYLINVGVRTFFVSPNDPISFQDIQSSGYVELIAGNTYVFDEEKDFYVGVYTGHGLPADGVFPDPIFAWAHLYNNSGKIELLDGALEYRGDGIYAGTLNIIQPVPEPGTWAFTVLGGMLLAWRHRVKDL